jgi:cation transport protein ChaC
MVALDTGGECHGLAFRIARERIETESDMLFRREMITSGYRADFVDVATPEGTVEALAFVADTGSDKYVGELDADEAAAIVATGSGVLGTNLEYLEELAGRLEDLNVPDPDFFALYERARKRAAR